MTLSYRKTQISRPVGKDVVLGFTDRQRILPLGWCPVCGGEIFARGKTQCIRCEKEAKKHERRKKLQSLCELHPGGESRLL